jgi:hypothetical protein
MPIRLSGSAYAVEGPLPSRAPPLPSLGILTMRPRHRHPHSVPPPRHKSGWHSLPNQCKKDPDYEGVMATHRHDPFSLAVEDIGFLHASTSVPEVPQGLLNFG